MDSDPDLFGFDVFEDEFMASSDTDEEPEDSNSLEAGPAPKTCKVASKRLLKKEKVHIASLLKQVDGECITEGVIQTLSGELHLFEFPERGEVLISIIDSSWSDLKKICVCLQNMFANLYLECDSGREKFATFQVRWHSKSAVFLSAQLPPEDSFLNVPIKLWLQLTNSVPRDVANPLMISISSAVYKYMLRRVRALSIGEESHNSRITRESDDVYLRFGGGNLASMYKSRYSAMKSKRASSKKDLISRELCVLDCIRMTDKSSLPRSLKDRDEGGMYFPDWEFLPYLKELDTRVRENANEDVFQRYGQDLVTVTTTLIMHNKELREQFNQCYLGKSKDGDVQSEAVNNVYNEFTRKLCNTRLNEYLDSHRQMMVANKGKATLSGQNLRDSLLSQHINLTINVSIFFLFHPFSILFLF
jgi:hypothetical protein